MAIVFARKLTEKLKELDIKKSDLRNDVSHNGSIRPSVLYRLYDKNRAYTVTTDTIDRLCKQLNCQPGDIMEYIPNSELEALGLCYDTDALKASREKE